MPGLDISIACLVGFTRLRPVGLLHLLGITWKMSSVTRGPNGLLHLGDQQCCIQTYSLGLGCRDFEEIGRLLLFDAIPRLIFIRSYSRVSPSFRV